MTCTDAQVVHHRASRVVPNWSPICWQFLLLLGPIRSGLVRSQVRSYSRRRDLVRGNARHELELVAVGNWLPLAVAAPSASSVISGGPSHRGTTASMRIIRSRCAAAALRASWS